MAYTIDGTPTGFGLKLYTIARHAINIAQDTANRNGAPVAVWTRDGFYAVSEWPDDCYDQNPMDDGWHDYALVEPIVYDLGEVGR